MDGIVIAVVSVFIIVSSVYLIIKGLRNNQSQEISKLHNAIHAGIGKIDMLTDEVRQLHQDERFDIRKTKKSP